MLKVMTVLGTRPEIIKLSRVIPELDKHFEHVLINTGQNFDPQLSDIFFAELNIRKPNWDMGLAGVGTEFVGELLNYGDEWLGAHKPDAVLILGDTNSAMLAYAAKRRKIPIFHMEAGNRCFDDRVPEEVNRRIVDHISDINMVYSEHARYNLLREGIRPETIIKTGSPMTEVVNHYYEQINASSIVQTLGLTPVRFFVFSIHREENVDNPDRLHRLIDSFSALRLKYPDHPIIFSLHPRTQGRLKRVDRAVPDGVVLTTPLGFFDYAQLLRHCACVFSDSGSLTEDATMLRAPSAVMLRQAHERPEGMDVGACLMSDIVPRQILEAVDVAMNQPCARLPLDYAVTDTARIVARTIQSYTPYVRRTVYGSV